MTSQRQSPEKEQEKIPVRKKTYQHLKSHIQSGKLNSGQRLNKKILIKAVAYCYLGRSRCFDGLW